MDDRPIKKVLPKLIITDQNCCTIKIESVPWEKHKNNDLHYSITQILNRLMVYCFELIKKKTFLSIEWLFIEKPYFRFACGKS